MTVGDVVTTEAWPSIPEPYPGKMGPTTAMREALAAYLLSRTFRVDGGDDPTDDEFSLVEALDHFPKPDEALKYPCASIEPIGPTVHDDALKPHPLEDTIGTFDHLVGWSGYPPMTCLWVTGDANVSLQLDFWCNRDPDRQAIEGALGAMFAPEQGRNSVVVVGPDLYFNQECEFSIMDHLHDDTGLSSQRGERRLRCVIAATCANVSLRIATIASARVTVDTDDPSDPGEDEEE